ncbi:apolipoprotein N-acyltransferase [Alginatibacterium sediminis]|uniref:apolipoprotein N-acyltransferase n=1 Tax=Alginatibacterium sediminis TaxID=2164068 RepID=UPI0011C3CBDD|nr:apolipoprotein N-acyltransferase [Alginatibacterium sediminis]
MALSTLKSWQAYLLAFLLGLSTPFSFAPFDIWPIMPLSLAGLWLLASHHNHPGKLGFVYGLGWFGYGVSWVHVSMAQFGGMPLAASLGLMLLLVSYLSLFPSLAMHLAFRWARNYSIGFYLVYLPSCWLLTEWLRSWLLTGFPWLQPGYSQLASPLSAFAPYLGVLGVSAATFVLSGILAYGFLNPKHRLPLAALIVLSAVALMIVKPIQWTKDSSSLELALVQGNIDLNQKWLRKNRVPMLQRYQELSLAQPQADVIIWPESAIAATEFETLGFLESLDRRLLERQQALVTGIIALDYQSNHFYNAMITLGQYTLPNTDQSTEHEQLSYEFEGDNRYYKQHLLPIGEFVPFETILRPLAPFFNLPMSSFARGDSTQKNLVVKGQQWIPAICYEIAFSELVRKYANKHSDAIITVSNDTWFGSSIGPEQHLQIAQMRALELQRPVIRSTNSGVTAIIDRRGQINAKAASFEEATLVANITGAQGLTPFQRWGERPLLYVMLLVLVVYRFRFKGK